MPGAPADKPPDLDAMFGDLFAQFFSGKLAADLSVDLALTETQAEEGVTCEIEVTRLRACAACNGRGSRNPAGARVACAPCKGLGKREVTQGFFKVMTACAACRGAGTTIVEPCITCDGAGRVVTPAKVPVTVPPKLEHGQILKLEGQGSVGDDGALGALYVYLLIGDRPDPRAEAFAAHAAAAAGANLPTAVIHRPPLPTWQVALIAGVVLVLFAVLLLAP